MMDSNSDNNDDINENNNQKDDWADVDYVDEIYKSNIRKIK